MVRLAREFRLVPLVVAAAAGLLALKTFGLIFDGGYTLGQPRAALAQAADEPAAVEPPSDGPRATKGDAPPRAAAEDPPSERQKSWAQEMFGYPEYTGSMSKPKPKPAEQPAEAVPNAGAAPNGQAPEAKSNPKQQVPLDPDHPMVSAGERAVLESLNQRRLELEARARALDMRENLLAAAEKRLEGRLAELKELEARINASLQKKDEAEAARFKGLVTMYENMKAKDAAKIFDRLDMKILLEVATQINPRRMSDILAQMSPDAAERLTAAIANRSEVPDKGRPPPSTLPKIEGRPSGS
jgi:flagellar motility protein MotE (MotC chaperone)